MPSKKGGFSVGNEAFALTGLGGSEVKLIKTRCGMTRPFRFQDSWKRWR